MFREALMVADLCPNIYFDTSSSNAWVKFTPGLTLEAVFETAALQVLGPERLLFGTDSSFFPRGWHRAVYNQQRTALVSLGVPDRTSPPSSPAELPERVFGTAASDRDSPRRHRATARRAARAHTIASSRPRRR